MKTNVGGDEKLQKHLEELGAATSGGAQDAVYASGKGLNMLARLFKSKSRDEDEDDDDDEDEPMEKNERGMSKSGNNETYPQSRRNGGDLEEEDEDPDDPADTGEPNSRDGGSIISNHGKRTSKGSLARATSKSYSIFDEKGYYGQSEQFEDVLDATPALKFMAKHTGEMGEGMNLLADGINTLGEMNRELAKSNKELQKQNRTLAKGLSSALEAIAGLASDLEAVKKQPVTANVNPGVIGVTLAKGDGTQAAVKLSKSDLADRLTEQLQKSTSTEEGNMWAAHLARLGSVKSQSDLDGLMARLPEDFTRNLA